jgi:purine-binding chemotaxis protein CheW
MVQVVLLPVGAEFYALRIDCVREVVAAPAVTRLPTAPPLVVGLLNLRGEIVPLLDTAGLLGIGETETSAFAAVLVTPQGSVALAATGFPLRTELGGTATPSELPGTTGTYNLDDRAVVLLDPDALLAHERLRGHDVLASAPAVGMS